MSEKLRNAYDEISDDYLLKKAKPWIEFREYYHMQPFERTGIVIDIGGGNGRNIQVIETTHPVILDLSVKLLQGFSGTYDTSRVAGALPKLPFRDSVADNCISIAVIHHLRTQLERAIAINEIMRINRNYLIISVWRKWRTGVKEKIIEAIKNGSDTDVLVNVERPWKKYDGSIWVTRFYHYFTYKELILLAKTNNLFIKRYKRLGGKNQDANFFITLSQNA